MDSHGPEGETQEQLVLRVQPEQLEQKVQWEILVLKDQLEQLESPARKDHKDHKELRVMQEVLLQSQLVLFLKLQEVQLPQ